MTAKEAYKILVKSWGELKITKCMEYDSIFTFALGGIAGVCSVNKKTGKVQKFIPTAISIDEYRAGKEVKNFI